MAKSTRNPTARSCIDCGREFVRLHGHICNTCTSARYRRRRGRKRYPTGRLCGWCRMPFKTENGSTACCSTHGVWLFRHGVPSASRELVHIPSEPIRWRSRFLKSTTRLPWWRVVIQGNCSQCGEAFTALSTTGDHRYCSRRCSRRARRVAYKRQYGEFAVSMKRRRRLYERDGWICQICGMATSREYSVSDPWSPTLDHIEPQSLTLLPDHSDPNLRTCHALCNAHRSDGALTDEEVRTLAMARR